MRLYQACLRLIETSMGREATDTDHLNTMGRRLFGTRYLGTFGCDQIPKTCHHTQSYIVNTDPSTASGAHWLAVYCDGARLIGYDSFGRDIHADITESEPDAEQKVHESNCGQRCLAWLCVAYNVGPNGALRV